jgi:protein involved in polysaccharide export with SLBB domain
MTISKTGKALAAVLSLFSIFALAACGGNSVRKPTAFKELALADPQRPFVIEPGDELDMRFFYNPELNDRVVVQPDGNISLQLVGEQMAAGKTPGELEKALREKYARDLKQTEITVTMRGFGGHQAFVDGEVTKPGPITLINGITAMQALAFSGGFKDTADPEEVVLIRRHNGTTQVVPLNLASAANGSDGAQDVVLLPHDVLLVPRSGVGDTNLWIDQYIRKNIPLPFGVGYGLN